VAAGVRDHSDFEHDPWGRLWRTLDFVNLFIYAGPDAAARTGRALRAMHRSIKGVAPDGRHYHALEPEAYAWVHATLCVAILGSQRLFGRRMRPDEVVRFYDEWRALGRLLGHRYEFDALRAYWFCGRNTVEFYSPDWVLIGELKLKQFARAA